VLYLLLLAEVEVAGVQQQRCRDVLPEQVPVGHQMGAVHVAEERGVRQALPELIVGTL